jgi:hypothetical protein
MSAIGIFAVYISTMTYDQVSQKDSFFFIVNCWIHKRSKPAVFLHVVQLVVAKKILRFFSSKQPKT